MSDFIKRWESAYAKGNYIAPSGGSGSVDSYTKPEVDNLLSQKENLIAPKNSAFNRPYGTTTDTVAEGNDYRFHEHSNKSLLDTYTQTDENITSAIALKHSPISLLISNGLLLTGNQSLSLNLASTSSTGALSSIDWNTFNNKENKLTFSYPLYREQNNVSLLYAESLKQTGNYLDTVQPIKTTSTPQFLRMGIGKVADNTYSLDIAGSAHISTDLTIDGNLTVSGDLTLLNVSTLQVEDKNIELGKTITPSEATAAGGGITLLGLTNKTIIWNDDGSGWTSSEDFNLVANKSFKIAGSSVLNNNTLGSGVINSSLTKVGGLNSGSVVSGFGSIYTTNDITGNTLTALGRVDQQGTANSEFGSQRILPKQKYYSSLGSITHKFLELHAAELWVENLVAQNTIATIGGRVLVSNTTTLINDINATQTAIDVKYALPIPCVAYMEAQGKVEFFYVSAQTSITGGYRITATRHFENSSGSGNMWYAGDAMVSTGNIGNGFIDLYSLQGITSANNSQRMGPTIVGNVRTNWQYNAFIEHWAVGNLNGLYGYASTAYGAAFGKYVTSGNGAYITIDDTNGIRIRGVKSGVTSDILKAGMDGNLYVNGSGEFTGKITATSGNIAKWKIESGNISYSSGYYITELNGEYGYLYAGNGVKFDTDQFVLLGKIPSECSHSGEAGLYARDNYSNKDYFILTNLTRWIAGWTFDNGKFFNGTDIILDASNKKISVSNNAVQMYYTSASDYGIKDAAGKFSLGSNNAIAGWKFDNNGISKGTYATSYNKITLNSTTTNDGSAYWNGNNQGSGFQITYKNGAYAHNISVGEILTDVNGSPSNTERNGWYGIQVLAAPGTAGPYTLFQTSGKDSAYKNIIAGWNFDWSKLYAGTNLTGLALNTESSAYLNQSTSKGFEVYDINNPKLFIGKKDGNYLDWNITAADTLTIKGQMISSWISTAAAQAGNYTYAALYGATVRSQSFTDSSNYRDTRLENGLFQSSYLSAGTSQTINFTYANNKYGIAINGYYATRYRGSGAGSVVPTADLRDGDMFFNTSLNQLGIYAFGAWRYL
jgi:hypothetical protein